MGVDQSAGAALGELLLQRREHVGARSGAVGVDARRRLQVADGSRGIADRQRRVSRAQQARARHRRADRDRADQRCVRVQRADQRAQARMRDATLRRVAGVHEVARAVVVAFLRRHRAQQREAIGASGQLRQRGGEAQARHARVDRLRGPAGAAPGLGIEGLELTRAAVQIQQHAGACGRDRGGDGRRCVGAAAERGERGGSHTGAEEAATGDGHGEAPSGWS
ncbi:MAG: hypothetical protein U0168_26325 [Nannocystaceae bacterium]